MKFIQIAVATESSNGEVLYALGDNGVIYERAGKNIVSEGKSEWKYWWRPLNNEFSEPNAPES